MTLARRAGRVSLAALLLAVSLVGLTGATPALAATPDLTIVTEAHYEVQPEQRRVHVTVDLHAVNHKRDTTTRRYYFDSATLFVQPGTSGFAISSSGAKPSVRVVRRGSDHTALQIAFGRKVYSGKQADLRLSFDIRDPGGAPTRQVRIGAALVSFPIWAFASNETPGSRVEVALPADYRVEFAAGSLPGPTVVGDRAVYRTGPIAHPLSFFAYLVADRPGAYASTTVEPRIDGTPVPVTIEAWTDDAAWAKRIGAVMAKGLPALGEAIGLPYARGEPLVVQESISRSLGGYAGLFDPAEGRIQVDYAATSFVALHETAHVWFNGRLLADRWANEAFASYYASRETEVLGLDGSPDRLTKDLEEARIPLNAWAGVGEEDDATEAYGYAAAIALAEAVAKRAGDAGLQATWRAAAARRSPYQPSEAGTEPEQLPGAPDWRSLLDLLETSTGQRFDDLWREWVARPQDVVLLDQRTAARTTYSAVVEQAGSWELPARIRSEMTTWRFADALGQLAQADAVLDLRDRIEREAAAADLTPPATLEHAFESEASFRAADVEGRSELAAIATIVAAAGTRPGDGPIEQLGLVGATPQEDMDAARLAFAGGDLATAVSRAEAARAAWDSADDVGTRRALVILGVVLLVTVLGWLTVSGIRGRRRRRRAARVAAAVAAMEASRMMATPMADRTWSIDAPSGPLDGGARPPE